MYTSAARRFGDCDVAVERQTGDHRVHGMLLQLRIERFPIGGIDGVSVQVGKAVCLHHGICRRAGDVGEMNFIRTRFSQQAGNQCTDLAGAENEHFLHGEAPWGGPFKAGRRRL